jgi:hypothetical protein
LKKNSFFGLKTFVDPINRGDGFDKNGWATNQKFSAPLRIRDAPSVLLSVSVESDAAVTVQQSYLYLNPVEQDSELSQLRFQEFFSTFYLLKLFVVGVRFQLAHLVLTHISASFMIKCK